MRIAVMGAGGVGGYLAGRIAEHDAAEVVLVARGAHLGALRRDGLHLRSVFGDVHVDLPATDDTTEVGPVDVVLFTVKATDNEAAARATLPLLHDDTAVISLQNGIDNEAQIGAIVGDRHVLGGAAFIFSTIAEPGVIDHTGGPTRFVFGELSGERTPRAEAFLAVCEHAGVTAELSTDVRRVMWGKYVFIASYAGMVAATRLPIGPIREDPAAREMLHDLLREACAVAAAAGTDLGDEAPDHVMAAIDGLDADAYASLHYDLVHGKPMELDALTGTMVRLAAEHGVPAPMHRAVYAVLSPWARRHAAGS